MSEPASRPRPASVSSRAPDPPRGDVRTALRALNRRLERRGYATRIPLEDELIRDRDRLSKELMRVLQITRDRDAFEVLYRMNAALLRTFCINQLRRDERAAEADDIVDEAFLQVFVKCRTFRNLERSTFTGWAFAIADNLIRTRRRRWRTQGLVLPLCDAELIPGPGGDPHDSAIESEVRETVEDGWAVILQLCAAELLRLPPRWRCALELREVRLLTYREIAKRLGCSHGHAGMLIRRARLRILKRLARTLARYDGERHGC